MKNLIKTNAVPTTFKAYCSQYNKITILKSDTFLALSAEHSVWHLHFVNQGKYKFDLIISFITFTN